VVAVLTAVRPTSHRTAEESLGLGYLASALRRARVRVRIVDGWLRDLGPVELAACIADDEVDWVGVSCYQPSMSIAIEFRAALRALRPEVPVVAGGYGPTFAPELFLAGGFECVVRGEAEETISQISAALSVRPLRIEFLSTIPGVSYLSNGQLVSNSTAPPSVPLDDHALPARDCVPEVAKHRSAAHVATSRGCSGHCRFCSIIAFGRRTKSPAWRGRTVDSIVQELEVLHSMGVRHVKVVDDSFLEPERDAAWCCELADKIEARGLAMSLRGQVRADFVEGESMSHLRRAGFMSFACGIENFADSALRRMAKSATATDNAVALDILREHDYLVQCGLILFDPATTLEELRINLDALDHYSWCTTKGIFSEMYAAPGTPFGVAIRRRVDQAKGEFNAGYEIADPAVRGIYGALRSWHRSIMTTYDMVIDPVTAPKALEREQLAEFEVLGDQLRLLDRTIFRALLDEASSARPEELLGLVSDFRFESTSQVETIAGHCDDLYRRYSLRYVAAPNPFI